MSGITHGLGVASKADSKIGLIQGRQRDYGAVLWKQPHLLDLSYAELEERNLEVKAERLKGVTSDEMKDKFLEYLRNETGIKAVVVWFSDLHGSLHTLDYDKKFVIDSGDNLTFDGSSIKGFSSLSQSDLRLTIDWASFRWLPADLFGAGKVMVFANVCNDDGTNYESDFRGKLLKLSEKLKSEKGITVNFAPEIEGFLFKGEKAEQTFDEKVGFELATMSGYFSSLPQDTLRLFIDKFAEAQRAFGFQNEKDHPEVAPAQFELNYRYSLALDAADQVQIYKLIARQVAKSMGFTSCFLPKPIANLNGSGMHANISLSKDNKNIFYDANDEYRLSPIARKFVTGILTHAKELCLVMNGSVNAYRRLDPNFEAPNEIKFSAIDRGSMIRIPLGNEKSARVEVRTVAPDCNPYMCIYALIMAGFAGIEASDEDLKIAEEKLYGREVEILPSDIYEALEHFENSEFMENVLGKESHRKFSALKTKIANRSPRTLGTRVKNGEILYHHDVSNQLIWDEF